jgi:hypothetical protein
MRQKTFKLPSGVEIEMRQVMIAEENYLAKVAKSGQPLERGLMEVLDICTVGIANPGPYDFLTPGGKASWKQMIRGDMFSALIQLRSITYTDGHLLTFEQRCPARSCKKRFTAEADLFGDLLWYDMPEESAVKLKSGEPFEVTIDDRLVKYTMAYGKTEETYNLLAEQNPGRDMSCGLRSRIISVEDVETCDILDWIDGRNNDPKCKYPGLSSEQGEELREAFDVVEGGVDTSIEVLCPKCQGVFDVNVPFLAFFLPGKGISSRRRKAREKKRIKEATESLNS